MRRSFLSGFICGLTVWAAAQLPRVAAAADPSLASRWQEAQQLQKTEQYAEAADRYRSILAAETHWKKRAKAACLAASCLDRVNRPAECLPLLDAAIAEADRLLAQGQQGVDESWTLSALYGKALACEKIGDRAGALKAIERLRAQFFESDKALEAIEIQARLDGWSPQQLARALAREQEAAQMAEQAATAFRQNQHPQAVEISDRILQQYADTAAVFPALRTKALALWQLHKYRDAKTVYQAILDRVKPIAPYSRLVRTAEYHVAWLDSSEGLKELVSRVRLGQAISEKRWQEVVDAATTVVRLDPDPEQVADARMMVIQALCWQRKDSQALAASEQLISHYSPTGQAQRFVVQVSWAHFFAGVSCERLGDYQAAMTHFQWIIQSPIGRLEPSAAEHILPKAYYRVWRTLRDSGASHEEQVRAANDFLERYPFDPDAKYVRRLIRQSATAPAP